LRRLATALVVAGVLAAMPSTASAGGFVIDFHDSAASGVEVYNFSDCAAPCDAQAISVSVERAGTPIGSAGPGNDVRVNVVPAPGDIVHIYNEAGDERATVPYDGVPSVDGSSPCIPPGPATLGGAFQHGVPAPQPFTPGGPHGGVLVDDYTALSIWRQGSEGFEAADQIATEGNRWTATFSRPLARSETIGLWHAYTIPTPVGVATVWSWRNIGLCTALPVLPMPEPPPNPAPVCTAEGIRAHPSFRARLERSIKRLRLRALRRGTARLAGLPSCAGGTVRVEIKAGGVVVAKGAATATGGDVTQALARTKRTARLAGRRRAKVKVTIRIADKAGGAVSWSRKLTLR
jgi:hypothetical protein